MKILFFALAAVSVLIFLRALQKLKQGKFYEDSFWLLPLGIFVWGDALTLAPFWALAFGAMAFLPLIWSLRLVLLFFFFRSFFEPIYWLNHQSNKDSFVPPMLRHNKHLDAGQVAIIFQTAQTIVVVLTAFLFIWSFFWP